IANRLRVKAGGGGSGGVQIKVETQMMFSDDLGDAILNTAEEQKATLIILGLSSKGMLTRLIEGNVAQAIVKGARMPVLLLPSDWTGPI
ncbi:MAG: universal stress protein, partial [Phycisphaerales bacterium]|nr:universal stress protein [Phycisphaerales bacterium]